MTWPFPPPTGPVPWTARQERQYQQQQKKQWEESPI